MKTTTKALTILICLVLVITLSACTNNDDDGVIAFNVKNLELNLNSEERLELLSDGLVVLDGIEWSTSNRNVAIVKNGLVFAKGIGEATISATYKGKKYDCLVSVKEDVITLSESSIEIELNEIHNIYVKQNGNIVEKGVTWRNSNDEIVSLDNGKVQGLQLGNSTVSAKYKDKAFICNVSVIKPFDVVGHFYCYYYVEEMDVAFEFDIEFKADNTYSYSRRANDFAEGVVINQGTWSKNNGMIICLFDESEMRFKGKKDTLESIGEIDTGGMVNLEMTFERVM